MKNIKLTLTFVVAATLLGCGGGGGGGSSNDAPAVAAKTITLFDTESQTLSLPKLMAFSGSGLLTVAVQGSDRVDTFNVNTGSLVSSYSVNDPFGVAVKNDALTGAASLYYAAGSGIYTDGGSTVVANVGGNYYGLAFLSATEFYVGNISGLGTVVKYTSSSINPQATITGLSGFPSALIAHNGFIYVTLTDGNIAKIDPTNLTHTNVAWGTFEHPNGIAIEGDYAYVANNGPNNNGVGAYISRIKMSDGSQERFVSDTLGVWQTPTPGFCSPAGLAIYSGYLYVSNGTCPSNDGNKNKILKVKLP
jgi:hypothetical protein